MINDKKLDFWINSDLNVLFEGKHGVGKSAIIIGAFTRRSLRYGYFSGATMDPYVDFVGIPTKVDIKRALCPGGEGPEPTDEQVLRFIRPEYLVKMDPEALFFDELNRAHKKIRNAVMELLQFKTINGEKVFPNLRMVWAAINPDSDTDEDQAYDTEHLDPAQRDRFQVQVEIPYKCDLDYFSKKYGAQNARAALAWWQEIPDKLKDKVSPRRLDYALEMQRLGGDLSDILPQQSNVSKLVSQLRYGSLDDDLKKWAKNQMFDEARQFLAVSNNFNMAKDKIVEHERMGFFLPLVPKEQLGVLFTKNSKVEDHILKEYQDNGEFEDFVESLESSKTLTSAEKGQKVARALAMRRARKAERADTKKTIDDLMIEVTKGRTIEQVYGDMVPLWKKTDLKTCPRADVHTWFNFIIKATKSRWAATLQRDQPVVLDVIRGLITHASSIVYDYPEFVNMVNDKYKGVGITL